MLLIILYLCILCCTSGKTYSIHHHHLKGNLETATVPELRQKASIHHPLWVVVYRIGLPNFCYVLMDSSGISRTPGGGPSGSSRASRFQVAIIAIAIVITVIIVIIVITAVRVIILLVIIQINSSNNNIRKGLEVPRGGLQRLRPVLMIIIVIMPTTYRKDTS